MVRGPSSSGPAEQRHRPSGEELGERDRTPANSRPGASRSVHGPSSGSVSSVSCQPPDSASRNDSLVTAVTTSPERQNARQCAAAGPRASSGAYVPDSPNTSGRSRRSRRATAVSSPFSPEAASPDGVRNGRRLSGSTRARYSRSVPWYRSGTPGIVRCTSAAPSTLARTYGSSVCANRSSVSRTGPPPAAGPAATKSVTARSYTGSDSVQLVKSPASRTAFNRAGSSRPAISPFGSRAQPTAVCQACQASCASGAVAGVARSSSVSSPDHDSGHSVSTAIRARTSALRLVSWVVSAVPVAGQSRASRAQNAWNPSGVTAGCPGSPPTSFAETSGTYR